MEPLQVAKLAKDMPEEVTSMDELVNLFTKN